MGYRNKCQQRLQYQCHQRVDAEDEGKTVLLQLFGYRRAVLKTHSKEYMRLLESNRIELNSSPCHSHHKMVKHSKENVHDVTGP